MNKKLLLLAVLLIAMSVVRAQVVSTVSSVSVCTGTTTVDIPVTVSSFNAVGSISLRYSYVNSEIHSPSVVYKDPGLTAWGTFLANTSTPGIIIISAYDPNYTPPITGLTLVDNTILFTLRFTIDPSTTSAELNFLENAQGTWCEYGGVGPDFTPFNDIPLDQYYFNGGLSVDAVPVSPALGSSTPAGSSVICAGYNSGFATFTGGSGGGSNEYQYSINDGQDWLAYTNGAAITTTGGVTSVKVRARRSGGACAASAYNTYAIWTFGTAPAAPALSSASPSSGTTVCAGYNSGTVTAAAGSGGSTGAADQYQLSIDGGNNWAAYTNGAAITTTGATGSIIIQSRRTAGSYGCTDTPWNTLCTWSVASTPTAPALSSASPANGSAVCEGFNTGTVTGAAGSGGSTGAGDLYQVSIDGGNNWTAYTNGAAIITTGGTGSVIVQSRRTAGTYGCSDSPWNTICSWTINARKTISGTFYYHKSSGDVLLSGEDITVKIYESSDNGHTNSLATDVTDENGYYEFTGLCPACDYDIVATSTHSVEGALNTTDAAQTNFWGPASYQIEKVRFHAGDVFDADLFIGGQDAGMIQNNYVFGTPAFDRPGWTFWRKGFSIFHNPTPAEPEYTEYYPKVYLPVNTDVDADMYGLVTGDFNRSFNPDAVKSASSTLILVNTGSRSVASNQEFELPVRMVYPASVGAISLVLNFPVELVEARDIIMQDAGGILKWTVKGNEIRISWHSPVPLELGEGDQLLALRLKTTALFVNGQSIRLILASDPLNELADESYEVIGDALLSIETIEASAVGIDEPADGKCLVLNCHPNPSRNFTIFTYTLPFHGLVVLEVNDLLGNKVASLVNENQASGEHMIKFDTESLPNGVYIASIRVKAENNESFMTIKLINNK
jgi:hypothetical protein